MISFKKKGISFGIPIFLFIVGVLITISAGWRLVSQTYLIQKSIAKQPQNQAPERKFNINNTLMQRPKLGEEFAEMVISSVSLDYPIIHGDRDEDLEKGIGHFAGSTLPGESGNVVICGHRDTVFKKLQYVKVGEEITIKTNYASFIYKVSKIRIVEADDKTVVVPSDKELLTMYTCYPFSYIGHAPKRYVIVADYVSSNKNKKT
ncbi:MAG: class D sortase [Clostridiaceae bacterium]|nr:class D sortase [Clostridiaceae bacterium]